MQNGQRLNQVLAIEKGAKGRAESYAKVGYRECSHSDLFDGFTKTYSPFKDDGVKHPAETKNVQRKAEDILADTREIFTELFDVTLSKDAANCAAKANVVVDGQILLENVPAVYLLFLEKQLLKVQAIFKALPTLDPATKWTFDEAVELFRSERTETIRTKKEQRALVLYHHTEEHPAQTQLITEDIAVGKYTLERLSGALQVGAKKEMNTRLDKLLASVKKAREQANMVDAEEQNVGKPLFDYLIG